MVNDSILYYSHAKELKLSQEVEKTSGAWQTAS